jgi:hypothetical protein
MTTVQIELPDQLAQDAERAGLLSPAAFEELLREGLRARSRDRLHAAMDRIAATNDLPYMSPEEVAEEIAIMRAEERAANAQKA